MDKVSEPVMTFSEAAKTYLSKYIKQKSCKALRLSLKKTGCSGLSYVLDEVIETPEEHLLLSLADDCMIYIDLNWLSYLKGINVDYVKNGLDSKLVFNNPNQKGQCGCGESFTVL